MPKSGLTKREFSSHTTRSLEVEQLPDWLIQWLKDITKDPIYAILNVEAASFRLALFIVPRWLPKSLVSHANDNIQRQKGEIFLFFTSLFKNKVTFPRSPLVHLIGQNCTNCSNLGQSLPKEMELPILT